MWTQWIDKQCTQNLGGKISLEILVKTEKVIKDNIKMGILRTVCENQNYE